MSRAGDLRRDRSPSTANSYIAAAVKGLAVGERSWNFHFLAVRRTECSDFSFGYFAKILEVCLITALAITWNVSLRAQLQAVPVISAFAGTGVKCQTQPCGDGGLATSATLAQIWGMAIDNSGNVYLGSGSADYRVREIDANGIITTVAGSATVCPSSTATCGDGGPATSANLNQPSNVALDNQGNIYIGDRLDNRIRKVTAATGVISTVVGTGVQCSSPTASCGDGGPATSAQLLNPEAIVLDSNGNLYVADTSDNRVRKVSATTGIITTVIGTGASCTSTTGGCGDAALATQAFVSQPRALAFDPAGNLYLAEITGQRFRKLTMATGLISTVAGTGATCSSSTAACGDGGLATSATLSEPAGIVIDNAGNLYLADESDNRIRKVNAATGMISTVVGSGTSGTGGNGAAATAATMNEPSGIAMDRAGNLYIGLGGSYQVRKVSFGTFGPTTVGGTSAVQNVLLKTTSTETITSLSVPASAGGKQEYTVGTMSGCTLGSSTSSGTTCTVPVTFAPAYSGDRPMPLRVVTSAGSISFPLSGNGTGPQTSLSPGMMTTVAGTGTACGTPTSTCGDGGGAAASLMNAPGSVFTDGSGNVWVADTQDNRVRKISAGGTVTTVAGTGAVCSASTNACGDGGAATAGQLNGPKAVFVDPAGNLYIADTGDNRVRLVTAGSQVLSTVAGTGVACGTPTAACGDGGLGAAALLNAPGGLAMDAQGNLYIADSGDNRIRILTAGYISTFAGTGSPCASSTSACGDGSSALLATFSNPTGLFVDVGSNLWIADTGDNRIRKIPRPLGGARAVGLVSTVAGTGSPCGGGAQACGDGAIATSAALNAPRGIVVDAGGDLYVADTSDNRVREVYATSMDIATIAGTGTSGYSGDSGLATAAMLNAPQGISLDSFGNLFLADTANHRIREVNVTSTVLTFASTPYGFTSSDSPKTEVLSNIGNAVLTFPIPSSGQNPSISNNFQLSSISGTACPAITSTASSAGTLASGQNCVLPISFVPQSIGSISGSLVIKDNALNSASGVTQSIALNGTATEDNPSVYLTSSSNPSTYGGSVVLTATLSLGCTGTITFKDGSSSLGSVSTSGTVSFTTSSLSGGTHSLVASYAGSADCNSVDSSTLLQTVKVPVTIAGSTTLNPSLYGDSVQLSYVFSGAFGTPTGTAALYDQSNLISTSALNPSGNISVILSSLLAGSHTLKIVYNGDANYF